MNFGKKLSTLLILTASSIALAAMPGPAQAAFPGSNGKVVFASDRDGDYEIYVQEGNQDVPLTANDVIDREPVWSPDGTRIAFMRAGDVWVMQADGSNQRPLADHTQPDSDPAWSPDGTKIAFASARAGQYDIWVTASDGSQAQPDQLTQNQDLERWPAWSPDGTKIAFGRSGDIHVMDADPRTADGAPLFQTADYDTEPAWSPDGEKIAFTSDRQYNWDIYIGDSDGTGLPDRLTDALGDDWSPAWSPDGRRIAFQSNRDGNWEVYVETLATEVEEPLTRHASSDEHPDWQPAPFDVAVAMTASADSVVVGRRIAYTITVKNEGPSAAKNIIVTDQLATGASLISAQATTTVRIRVPDFGRFGGSYVLESPRPCAGTTTVTCDLGALAPGDSARATIVAQANIEGLLENVAAARALGLETNTANNRAVVRTTALPAPQPGAGGNGGDGGGQPQNPQNPQSPQQPQGSQQPGNSVSSCTITGTAGNDVLRGTPGPDVICGLAGNDRIRGLAGADVLRGGAGRDRLVGGKGRDVLLGGVGRDLLRARDGVRDQVHGGNGRDRASFDRSLDSVRAVERAF